MATPLQDSRPQSPRLKSKSPVITERPLDTPENNEEVDLSDEQLRQIYDDEEIDRFLHLFSAYVTEVRRPNESGSSSVKFSNGVKKKAEKSNSLTDDPVTTTDNPEQTPIEENPRASSVQSLSEYIAQNYLVPRLPIETMDVPPFTYGRLRLTSQRLYLSVQPVYGPFFKRMIKLATWEDWWASFKYCATYWALWLNNLLLPSLVLCLLYSLFRRRIFPYPTLTELRDHRKEVSQAAEFGEEVQARLSATSLLSVKELWRIFRLSRGARGMVKKMAKADNGGDKDQKIEGYPTVLDDGVGDEGDGDYKRAALQALTELADFHERVKNVFTWRRPASSKIYAIGLTITFLITLLPTVIAVKIFYFIVGFLFWHIAPVIASMSTADRARLPVPLSDVPTDAEYAMELITKRVAAGLPIKPRSVKERRIRILQASASTPDLLPSRSIGNSVDENRMVDWKKWGGRAAFGKSLAGEGRRLLSNDKDRNWPPNSPFIPEIAVNVAQPAASAETHSYPAQHYASPGLLTLNHCVLEFTPLFSSDSSVIISLSDLRGVRKSGILGGLSLRFGSPGNEKEEKEERFRWVGSRDDLFARLVAIDGKCWKQAI